MARVVVTRGRSGLEMNVFHVGCLLDRTPGVTVTDRRRSAPPSQAGGVKYGDRPPTFTFTIEADDETLSALDDALADRARLER